VKSTYSIGKCPTACRSAFSKFLVRAGHTCGAVSPLPEDFLNSFSGDPISDAWAVYCMRVASFTPQWRFVRHCMYMTEMPQKPRTWWYIMLPHRQGKCNLPAAPFS